MASIGLDVRMACGRVLWLCAGLVMACACGAETVRSTAATPASLAVRSASSYDDNESGVITSERLTRWLDAWAEARPADVRGELVILQLDEAPAPGVFLASAPGVRVYHAPELARLLEPRNNGLLAIGTVPADGIRVDSFLRHFDIEPNHDFVLLVAGEASERALITLARAWLVLRYWGFEHTSLGILDGSIGDDIPEAYRADVVAAHPFTGTARVTTLPNDHFVLLADVGAVRDAIGRELIVDARSAEAHAGLVLGASERDETCLHGAPHCTPTFSGHIAGALRLPWQALVTSDARFLAPAEIEAAAQAAGITPERTAYVYDLEGEGSAVVAFALLGIVGQPVRWYAASFLEWGSLNASHPIEALRTLPAESPWRTDVFPTLTGGARVWSTLEEGVRPLVFDPAASATDRVQQSDRAYKQDPPALPAVGVGGGGC